VPSADTAAIKSAIRKAASVKSIHLVRYAQISGFEATNSGTVQVTGPGKVIAFDKDYLKAFPHRHEPTGNLISQALNRRSRTLSVRNHADDLR
jgi:hypothetical protein